MPSIMANKTDSCRFTGYAISVIDSTVVTLHVAALSSSFSQREEEEMCLDRHGFGLMGMQHVRRLRPLHTDFYRSGLNIF